MNLLIIATRKGKVMEDKEMAETKGRWLEALRVNDFNHTPNPNVGVANDQPMCMLGVVVSLGIIENEKPRKVALRTRITKRIANARIWLASKIAGYDVRVNDYDY